MNNTNSTLVFNYTLSEQRCKRKGMPLQPELLALADRSFVKQKLTQADVDEVMNAHIYSVSYLFDRKKYSRVQRFFIALYWLGVAGKRINSDA